MHMYGIYVRGEILLYWWRKLMRSLFMMWLVFRIWLINLPRGALSRTTTILTWVRMSRPWARCLRRPELGRVEFGGTTWLAWRAHLRRVRWKTLVRWVHEERTWDEFGGVIGTNSRVDTMTVPSRGALDQRQGTPDRRQGVPSWDAPTRVVKVHDRGWDAKVNDLSCTERWNVLEFPERVRLKMSPPKNENVC